MSTTKTTRAESGLLERFNNALRLNARDGGTALKRTCLDTLHTTEQTPERACILETLYEVLERTPTETLIAYLSVAPGFTVDSPRRRRAEQAGDGGGGA